MYAYVLVGSIKESEPEARDTRKRVEEGRHLMVDAVIVRQMKARSVLEHNTLISEVTRSLQSMESDTYFIYYIYIYVFIVMQT